MMIYQRYVERFEQEVLAKVKPGDVVVDREIWIGFAYLDDQRCEPWQKDRFEKILHQLQREKEYSMISAIHSAIEAAERMK